MKNPCRLLLRYEGARAKANWRWMLTSVLVLLVFLVLFAVLGWAQASPRDYPGGNRDSRLLRVQEELQQIETALGRNLSDFDRARLEKERDLYRYYLDTGTVEDDYRGVGGGWNSPRSEFRTITTLVNFAQLSGVAWALWALFCCIWFFSAEFGKNGTGKNILAAPIKRNSVFWTKLPVTLAATLLPMIVISVVLLIVGACVPTGQSLLYLNGQWQAVSDYILLIRMIVQNVLVALSIIAFALPFAVSKKTFFSALFPLLYFGISFILVTLFETICPYFLAGGHLLTTTVFVPILGLCNGLTVFEGAFWVQAVLHTCLIAVSFWWCHKKYIHASF